MKKYLLLAFIIISTIVLSPLVANAANVNCPSSVSEILSRTSTISLLSCSSEQNYYFVVQDYQGETQEYAGITLSVYDSASFSSAARPLAVIDGLGEQVMKFKFDGQIVDHWTLDPIQASGQSSGPGIILRLWNPPAVGIVASFRYDVSTKKLEQIGAFGTELGSTPELSEGVFVISGKDQYSNGTPFAKVYNFDAGKFTLKSQGMAQ
jgi:hypothetical protein